MTENVSSLPEQIAIDLDSEERPKADIKPPFRAKVAGRVIEMKDPADLDWRDLLMLESPTEFLRLCLTVEDRKFLYEQKTEGWRFNRLMEAFYNHFDLDEKMREARRQQQLGGL